MSAITLQCLLKIRPWESSEVLRFQNYQRTDLFWDSQAWPFGKFTIDKYPKQSLELSDDSAKIIVPNNELIRGILDKYDGLRRANVEAWHIEIDSDRPPRYWILQVLDSAPIEASIVFNLRSPTSAIFGPVTTRYISTADFPELPVYSSVL